MIDYRKLLDVVMEALSRPEPRRQNEDGAPQPGPPLQIAGQTPGQLLQKAKDMAAQHPGLTQAALLGVAGLMFRKRKRGGLTSSLAQLGGLALIGGLAYKAFQNQQKAQAQTGRDGSETHPSVAPQKASQEQSGQALDMPDLPPTSRFHPVSQTEDDALLFLRTMVAAAASDGRIDETERSRIIKGLSEAGIDPQASRWLADEMESPADVEELAAGVNDPEKAAQVYAAARLAVDPDTIQEREFLHQLAEALDLDQTLRTQIEQTMDALR